MCNYGGGGGLVAKSCQALETPWTGVHQTPLSMEFSRQEYRGGLPFLSSGDLQNPGIKPVSPALLVGSLPPSHQGQVTIRYLTGICKIPSIIRSKHLENLGKSVMLNLCQVHVFWSHLTVPNIFITMNSSKVFLITYKSEVCRHPACKAVSDSAEQSTTTWTTESWSGSQIKLSYWPW